jgi:hypothetical protein
MTALLRSRGARQFFIPSITVFTELFVEKITLNDLVHTPLCPQAALQAAFSFCGLKNKKIL